jgi:hypothetical protein
MLNLPEIKRKKPKAPYRKPEAVKELERMADAEARLKHPTMAEAHLAPRTFRDDKAGPLTICIVKYITLKGGFASRISNQGTYNQKLRRYIRGTARKGLADIMGTFRGLSLHIEIKAGKDRQSDEQKRIESEIKRSGGLYYLARDFTTFKQWFDNI